MHITLENATLRKPEPTDVEALYVLKNDPSTASMLGGFSTGYSRSDLSRWVESHGQRQNEVLYIVANRSDDTCVGHVGLYDVDFRLRAAEFGILLGKPTWGKGIGRACTAFMVRFAFDALALHRVSLEVLETNVRAIHLYQSLGFVQEGRLRDARWVNGAFCDLIVMSVLEDDYRRVGGDG